MRSSARLSLLFLLFTFACGCAERTLVALIPDPEGKSGSIIASNESGKVVIDTPYQATTIGTADHPPTAPEPVSKQSLDKMFAEALSIEPQRPLHFLLYFKKGTMLRPDSERMLPDILAAIRERHSVYVSVIGHTDTLGSPQLNLELSKQRAVAVRDLLIERGVPAENIETVSHGKENLLIPTAENFYEPRNRRVEIVVR